MSGPSVCARCAARGTGCCTSEPGIFGPPLTPGDESRIEAATGLPRARFVHERALDPEEQRAWEEDVPAVRGLARDGRIRSLARPEGRCLLLGERGCTLPVRARPLLCRTFPFVIEGRVLRVQPAGECLAVEETDGAPGLARALGTSMGELVRLDRKVRREAGGR